MNSRIALARQELLDLVATEVVRHVDCERDEHPRVCAAHRRLSREIVVDRLGVVAAHLAAAVAAMEHGRARVEELHVIVELRHRADRRARRAHGVHLIDGDRGRDAFDPVDLRFVHAVEELARVGRECFYVTPLAFGVHGVERQRRLARAADARDDDELAERQVEIEGAEIVLPRPADADDVVVHG